MGKETGIERLTRPLLLSWLALGLLVISDLALGAKAAWASSSLQSQPYAGSAASPVTSDNVAIIIIGAVIGLLIAIGLGYTLLKLTRDSG